jgi:sugar phosphate isomerase/epimerase
MDGLIGYTGFVGGNLLRQRRFDAFFNSANVDEIRGRRFDLLACAGTPAVMYRANQQPAEDLASIRRLMDALASVEAMRFVLISTIYVYRDPVGVDERTPVTEEGLPPYGTHRLMLETFVRERFGATAIRLPNIFGDGIKKNVLFDLLNDNHVSTINAASVYQYYSLDHLWPDVSRAMANGVDVLNVATEPVSVREIARGGLGIPFENDPGTPPVFCDFRSAHAGLWGKPGGYLYSKAEVLDDIRRFVARYRSEPFRLAVSSIAWKPEQDAAMRDALAERGVQGVELLPDRLFDERGELSLERAAEQRRFWAGRGISVIAVQGVLFTRDDLKLFESGENRANTFQYLKTIIVTLRHLGAGVLMFGSPRNRRRADLSKEAADRIAVPFFRDLADFAYANDVVFCIEPNPEAYGADYLQTTAEAYALAEQVNHPGFAVNVDTGAMLMGGESLETPALCARRVRHVHISQPNLGPVADIGEDVHARIAGALRRTRYAGWVSIEMKRAPEGNDNIARVLAAVDRVRAVYAI